MNLNLAFFEISRELSRTEPLDPKEIQALNQVMARKSSDKTKKALIEILREASDTEPDIIPVILSRLNRL